MGWGESRTHRARFRGDRVSSARRPVTQKGQAPEASVPGGARPPSGAFPALGAPRGGWAQGPNLGQRSGKWLSPSPGPKQGREGLRPSADLWGPQTCPGLVLRGLVSGAEGSEGRGPFSPCVCSLGQSGWCMRPRPAFW